MKFKTVHIPGAPYTICYENGEVVIGAPKAIHCVRNELQAIEEYVKPMGRYASLGSQFPDTVAEYRACSRVLEAHSKHKTVGQYLLSLARVDDPERSSDLEKLLLRPASQKNLCRR